MATLMERLKSYDRKNYGFFKRWYLRARMTLMRGGCCVGYHQRMGGYSNRVWCWLCGKRITDENGQPVIDKSYNSGETMSINYEANKAHWDRRSKQYPFQAMSSRGACAPGKMPPLLSGNFICVPTSSTESLWGFEIEDDLKIFLGLCPSAERFP